MITIMSELSLAPQGPYVQGTIVPDPSQHVIPAGDVKAHGFFNVIRDLLTASNLYHSEGSLTAAIEAVTAFEKHILSGDHRSVIQEHDVAPKEDVSQRVAPQVGTAVAVPSSGAGLDYNRLAAAIVALQQQQAAEHTNEEGPPA